VPPHRRERSDECPRRRAIVLSGRGFGESLLEGRDASRELCDRAESLRQLALHDDGAAPSAQIVGRRARDDSIGGEVAADASLGRDPSAVTDLEVPGHADLPSEDDIIADAGAPGDADLCQHDAARAQNDVMSEVYEVVNSASRPHPGRLQRPGVDAGPGSDVDVVADDDTSDMRSAHSVSLRLDPISESRRADDRVGTDVHAAAQLRPGHENSARTDGAADADSRAGLHDRVRTDHRISADDRTGRDDRSGGHRDALVDVGIGMDASTRRAPCVSLRELDRPACKPSAERVEHAVRGLVDPLRSNGAVEWPLRQNCGSVERFCFTRQARVAEHGDAPMSASLGDGRNPGDLDGVRAPVVGDESTAVHLEQAGQGHRGRSR